jgi:hypothetical protein
MFALKPRPRETDAPLMTPVADATVREPLLPNAFVRIDLEARMRLREMIGLEAALRRAMALDPIRVVLDCHRLQSMTQGAILALTSLTVRLERAGIELVLER